MLVYTKYHHQNIYVNIIYFNIFWFIYDIRYQFANFEAKLPLSLKWGINLEKNWPLWLKKVITQILHRLFYLISTLAEAQSGLPNRTQIRSFLAHDIWIHPSNQTERQIPNQMPYFSSHELPRGIRKWPAESAVQIIWFIWACRPNEYLWCRCLEK